MGNKVSRTMGVVIALCAFAAPACASFHLMQIEQVIAGVGGDSSAQAIQLRMRGGFQNFVDASRIRAWDAAGANPVLVIDLDHSVANGQTGDRVLIASASFLVATNPAASADFLMSMRIPESYFSAGSLTFEGDDGTVYWRLSWGGTAYTGSTFGASDNDNDPGFVPANFGPPFAGPLPSASLQALRFTGTASALSTTNQADYSVTAAAAIFTNNARNSFTVAQAPPVVGDIDGDRDADAADLAICIGCLSGPDSTKPVKCGGEEFMSCDFDEDGDVDLADHADFELHLTD